MPELNERGCGYSDGYNKGNGFSFGNGASYSFGDGSGDDFGGGYSLKSEWEGILCQN